MFDADLNERLVFDKACVGGGGNFLVGGQQNTYALQPISVQGQTGLNVAAGVASIDLEPVVLPHRGQMRHRPHQRYHR